MNDDIDLDDTILQELKREARRRGHLAITVSEYDIGNLVILLCGVYIGAVLAFLRS